MATTVTGSVLWTDGASTVYEWQDGMGDPVTWDGTVGSIRVFPPSISEVDAGNTVLQIQSQRYVLIGVWEPTCTLET